MSSLLCRIFFISLAASAASQRIFNIIRPTRPTVNRTNLSVTEAMTLDTIVPDVIDVGPQELLQVKYGGKTVNLGNTLTPLDVQDSPSFVKWPAKPEKFYLLLMIDPDAPTKNLAVLKEWSHWLVGNIPGNALSEGQVIHEYAGAGPRPGTGLHRYVFLVFQQPDKLEFSEPHRRRQSMRGRARFNTKDFASKYNLGNPVAGNYFHSKYVVTDMAKNVLNRMHLTNNQQIINPAKFFAK